MLKQFIRKKGVIAYGALQSLAGRGHRYEDSTWWDRSFYTAGVSDRQTISPMKDPLSALYHYHSIEILIIRHLFNEQESITGQSFLDIGAGSGHWIDFYRSLGTTDCVGVDVSRSSVEHLRHKYAADNDVAIEHGKALDYLAGCDRHFDFVNAIGVMFHIVDDEEWAETVRQTARVLKPNGMFVIGGHFGLLNGLNVHVSKEDEIFKRLRSRRNWINTLRKAGFAREHYYRNNAYLAINDPLPQNNVLIATMPA